MSDCLSKPIVQCAAAILLPNIGGLLSSRCTNAELKSWYENLKFPKCRPPNFVFYTIWPCLYTSMGYASYLVWKNGGGFNGAARFPLMLYGAQLALNMAWVPLFFGKHQLKWSSIEIVAVTATAAATGISFFNIDKIAGYLFIPYVVWLTFASYLKYSIYRLNTPAIEDKKEESKSE